MPRWLLLALFVPATLVFAACNGDDDDGDDDDATEEPEAWSCPSYGVTADGAISVQPGAGISAWNSHLAAFTSATDPTTVATNAVDPCTVEVNQAQITGDVFVGTDGDPATAVCVIRAGSITGALGSLEDGVEIPTVAVPTGLGSSDGDLVVDVWNPKTITGPTVLDSLTVTPGGTLTIDGAVTLHVLGDVDVNQSDVVLAPGASLDLYVSGAFTVRRSADFGEPENAVDVTVWIDGAGPAEVTPGASLAALVVHPDAPLTVNQAALYGATVGQSTSVIRSGDIYVDEALLCD